MISNELEAVQHELNEAILLLEAERSKNGFAKMFGWKQHLYQIIEGVINNQKVLGEGLNGALNVLNKKLNVLVEHEERNRKEEGLEIELAVANTTVNESLDREEKIRLELEKIRNKAKAQSDLLIEVRDTVNLATLKSAWIAAKNGDPEAIEKLDEIQAQLKDLGF